jgi:bisanhydrobacterioruberin hydratase
MNWHKLIIWILGVLFLFMLGGAILSHLLWRQPPIRGFGSSLFLYIAGALVFLSAEKQDRIPLLCAGLIGFIAEVIGVRYGWLFGHYYYTEVLAPNWLGTPVVMICAWFILIAYVRQLIARLHLSALGEVCFGSVWMTALDLLIDPLAAHSFDFWKWLDSGAYYGIPLRNFLGWFGVSAVIFSADKLLFRRQIREHFWVYFVGLGIIALYTIAAFIYGYFLAGVVGIGLSTLHFLTPGLKSRIFTRNLYVND